MKRVVNEEYKLHIYYKKYLKVTQSAKKMTSYSFFIHFDTYISFIYFNLYDLINF